MFNRETFDSLHDLFVHELKDLYDAEQRVLDTLPAMKDAATSPDLVEVLEAARVASEAQKGQLEKVFASLSLEPQRESCPAMKGIVDEASHLMKAYGDDASRDAAIISSINRIQHYEIAGYGTLKAFANELGYADAAKTLDRNLKAGYVIDRAATVLAKHRVNQNAAAAIE